MRINSLIVVVLGIAVVALASSSKTCKYWCKTNSANAYYCCPTGKTEMTMNQSVWPMMYWPMFWIGVIGTSIVIHAGNVPQTEKPKNVKKCPPLRSICPRSFDWYDPPSYCDGDEECRHMEKCCYDVCLEHKTCKPAE